MTNTTHSPLILNDDIRAYLLTAEAKISYEGGVTFLKEEVNSELTSTLNDFMGEYGAEIAGVVETGKQALRDLGNAASTAAQKATALETLNQLAKDIDQYAKAYQEIPGKITNPKLAENFKKSIGHVLGSLAETISDQKMAVQLLNQMSDVEHTFKGAGKAIAGIGTVLSILDLGSAVVNEDGDAFGKSLTGLAFGTAAGSAMATTMTGGATTIAGLVASKLGVAALLGPALGGAIVAGAAVWIAVKAGGYVWDEFIHPDLPVEEQLAAIEVASMIINHFSMVNSTPVEVVKTLFGDNEVKEMDFDKVIKVYQHLIKLAKGDAQAGDSISDLESLVLDMDNNKEALEQFTSIKNVQFILAQGNNQQAIIQQASEDGDVGLSYRYALKALQPFVIVGDNVDYSQFNQNGELNLASENHPDGMSEQYVADRAKMLAAKIEWNSDANSHLKFDTYYKDFELNENYGQKTSTDAVKYNPWVIFGSEGDDTLLRGNQKDDHIYGGGGSDNLRGRGGSDYLEGGTGDDIYHIEDHDTIFDSDADGTVMFDDATVGYLAWQKSSGRWESSDGEVVAVRAGDNLVVTKGDDQATITDFFTQISMENNTYSGYGISLGSDKEKGKAAELDADDKSMHIWASGDLDFTINGSEKSDLIMLTTVGRATVEAGDGRDRIYGSLNNDKIHAGKGNDVIYGSPALIYNKDESTFAADADVISGGEGSDIILGRVGDDALYANDNKAYQLTEASSEQGDWVNGDLGNDKIFGSQSADMLQGGAGVDTIRGGASADVIIGDGNSELTVRANTIATNVTANLTNAMSIFYEYNITDQAWDKTPQSVYTTVNLHTAEWSVAVKNGDYHVEAHYDLPAAVHRVETGGMADFLFGDGGNDLIIGQDGNDYLYGGNDDDTLWGDDNRDLTISGNDHLDGGNGQDTLHAGSGDDTLIGGNGQDKLLGGEGFDTYVFATEHLDAVDTITDSDGKGAVYVAGQSWSAKTWTETAKDSQTWKDDAGNTLTLSGGQLKLTTAGGQGVAVIENFSKGDLGFDLQSNENQAPEAVGSISAQNLTTTEAWSLATASAFSDADGDTLSYSATLADGSALPSWLQINTSTGQLSGTPSTAEQLSITVTATDPSGETVQQTLALNIVEPNKAPELVTAFADVSVESGSAAAIQLPLSNFSDPDGDALTYRFTQSDGSALPSWLNVDVQTGALSGTAPVGSDDVSVKITATDPSGLSVSDDFIIDVKDAPVTANTPWNGGTIEGGSGNDTLGGSWFSDTLNGNDGDDNLSAGLGADTLNGGAGNDTLDGGWGADTLTGGTGRDTLNGGLGSDTYIFNAGDGQDTIADSGGLSDKLILNGLSLNDLLLDSSGDNWVISVKGSDDQITIKDADSWWGGRIETIQVGNESYSYSQFESALSTSSSRALALPEQTYVA